jgi:serine/threonine-protein kinase
MELIDGISLDNVLIANKRLTPAQAVDIARQLADALDYLHRSGYVHRDIKPANLMLTPEGRVVLFDFGTVVRIKDGAPYEAGLYGTPSFLAPEQTVAGGKIDGRADLYSAGIMLFLMVTGRKPFYGSRSEVLDAHVSAAPPRPSQFARISPALEAMILKTIAKNPDDRFQTGAELAQALATLPSLAPPSIGDRLRGWLRRGA